MLADKAAGARLDGGERAGLGLEEIEDGAGKRGIAGGEDHVGQRSADGGFAFVNRAVSFGDAQRALVADADGEDGTAGGDAGEGHGGAFGEVAQFGDGIGLADANDMEQTCAHGVADGGGAEEGQDLGGKHGAELAGRAGEGEEVDSAAGALNDDVEAGRGAKGVGEAR